MTAHSHVRSAFGAALGVALLVGGLFAPISANAATQTKEQAAAAALASPSITVASDLAGFASTSYRSSLRKDAEVLLKASRGSDRKAIANSTTKVRADLAKTGQSTVDWTSSTNKSNAHAPVKLRTAVTTASKGVSSALKTKDPTRVVRALSAYATAAHALTAAEFTATHFMVYFDTHDPNYAPGCKADHVIESFKSGGEKGQSRTLWFSPGGPWKYSTSRISANEVAWKVYACFPEAQAPQPTSKPVPSPAPTPRITPPPTAS